MRTLNRGCWLLAMAAITHGWAGGLAHAQPPVQRPAAAASLADAKARVAAGDVVYVTDASGATIKGKLAALTDDEVQIVLAAGRRSVAAADVRRIQRQQPDSPLTGVAIGAAIGAIPGIYWLIADPNECTGMCPGEYVAIGVGALVGGLIDRAVTKKVTVYSAEAPGDRAPRVTIAPLVMRDRKGVQVALTF